MAIGREQLELKRLFYATKKQTSMKKTTILFFVGCVMTIAAHAQEFKKFKVGVGVGYARASGKGAKGGVLATLEPAYRISDIIQVGLRIESAVVVRGGADDYGLDLEGAAIGSYSLNGQYYFSNESFRPFVGAGLGMYSLAALKLEESGAIGEIAASEGKFGFYPRVGFDAGHFTLSLDYNFIPATKVDGAEFKNSYLGFRIGGFFGGGRK
jgi:hypothetical protein